MTLVNNILIMSWSLMVSLIIRIFLIFSLTSCLIVPRDDISVIRKGVKNENILILTLNGIRKKNDNFFPEGNPPWFKKLLTKKGYNKIDTNSLKLNNDIGLSRWAMSFYKPYSNQEKYILYFATRPSWEIEFYNPESSPKPNYHLVYFSDISDRKKCSNYLSKKHKPIEDWYYTNKFKSLKSCLGIDK